MFDFGLGEIMLLGSIALIAIGPKQLPEVAKTVGKFVGELRRYSGDLTRQVIEAREATNLKLMMGQMAANGATPATGAAAAPIASHAYDPHSFVGGYHDPDYNPDQLIFEFKEFIDCYPTSQHSSHSPHHES